MNWQLLAVILVVGTALVYLWQRVRRKKNRPKVDVPLERLQKPHDRK